MMVAQGQGLIVTISSMGGLRYLFNVPYGVGKAAVSSPLVSPVFVNKILLLSIISALIIKTCFVCGLFPV